MFIPFLARLPVRSTAYPPNVARQTWRHRSAFPDFSDKKRRGGDIIRRPAAEAAKHAGVSTQKRRVSPLGDRAADVLASRRSDRHFAELEKRHEQSLAIADLVILHRTRKGMTQRELAACMGTSETAVARLESGFHLPSTETLRRLAAALGGRLTIGIAYDEPKAATRGGGRRAAR
jgi:ribosome-binding protein aMBF1 (putative translation factor)